MENKVVIIGGGPAGLSAAIYLGRAGLSPLVFAGSPPGGQLTLTSEVENYPGVESILGAQLIERMRHQAEKFGAKIVDENVVKVDFSRRPFKVFLDVATGPVGVFSPENFISSSSVIIATGAKALWLGVPGEEKLRGKGVSACATCDGFFFRDKVVAVVGGGDTAMEEALTLTKFAKKVYLIHRRNKFRASKIMQERVIGHPKIEIIYNTVVEEIIGDNRVREIKLKTQSSKLKTTTQNLKVDGIFVAIGHKPDTEIFKGQVEMDEKGYIITTQRMALENIKYQISNIKNKEQKSNIYKLEKFNFQFQTSTSVEGIFAAGDCVDFAYRQAATAAGMGVAAALEVERWIDEKG